MTSRPRRAEAGRQLGNEGGNRPVGVAEGGGRRGTARIVFHAPRRRRRRRRADIAATGRRH